MSTTFALLVVAMLSSPQDSRPRAREAGIMIGSLPAGPHDAITDVAGVRVGHATLSEGDNVRTGVTVVLPPGDNPFRDKLPAAIAVQNGFGKLIGATQVRELGTLESPIALTNTLSVWRVADALAGHVLALPGNEAVRSVNVVAGETNDGLLNDIRARRAGEAEVHAALAAASGGPVAEGCVGAGTGTTCLGWKGGIGTSSRIAGKHTVGVLVQSNFGGGLRIDGVRVAPPAGPDPRRGDKEEGSCMIVIATDAPLDARALERLATRSFAGMARIGAAFSNGSGDYALAFSTGKGPALQGDALSPLFVAVAEATETAILNSLLRATTTTGNGRTVPALPTDQALAAWRRGR